MFGTINEKALEAYAEQVKEKKVRAKQGTEYADNLGVGNHDHSFLDKEKRNHDFGDCLRGGKLK